MVAALAITDRTLHWGDEVLRCCKFGVENSTSFFFVEVKEISRLTRVGCSLLLPPQIVNFCRLSLFVLAFVKVKEISRLTRVGCSLLLPPQIVNLCRLSLFVLARR
jgi:hypothetical protein